MQVEPSNVLDALPGLVWTVLPDGRTEHSGTGWLDYAGLTGPEAPDRGWQTIVHPGDAAKLRADWAAVVASGQLGDLETRLRRFDGKFRRFLVRVRPTNDEHGEIARWCCLGIDIEDKARAEEVAREELGRFQRIVDGLPANVALFGADGQIIFANRHMLEYVDQTLVQLRHGEPAYSFHIDDRPAVLKHWRASVSAGVPIDCEARVVRWDGAERWHWVRGFPLRDAEGRTDLWYGLYTDIDDAKRAEAQLAGEKLLLEKIALGLPLPEVMEEVRGQIETLIPGCLCSVVLIDHADGVFRVGAASGQLEAANGLFDGQPIDPGSDPLSLAAARKTPIDTTDAANDPLWTTSSPWRAQMAELGLASCSAAPILSSSEEVLGVLAIHRREPVGPSASEQGLIDRFTTIVGIAVERAQADEALGRARDELAHMARMTTLSALTASIAHEVSQPLAGIITNAGTCLRILAADQPNLETARTTAQRTIRDANRASEVVLRLRALFARKTPAREPVDLNDAAREVLVLLSSELQRGRVMLRSEFASDLPVVLGDRVQLQQVVMNLLRNAADAMDNIEARPRDLFVATGWEDDSRVYLSVRDAGVGLDAQTLGKVFDPFFTTKGSGMGIGLAISRSIIDSHEGRLWAAPNEGPGATFAFSLPLGPAEGAAPTGARLSASA
jgi:PAS domain S-box-containing protein